MKGKSVFSLFTALACSAVLVLSPWGFSAARDIIDADRASNAKYETYTRNLETTQTALRNTVQEFNDSRTFDIYYGDIERIVEILSGLPGVAIEAIYEVDPTDNYGILGDYQEGFEPAAVQMNLLVTDAAVTLAIIEKMQLPVESVSISYPNTMSVVFLTGGAV